MGIMIAAGIIISIMAVIVITRIVIEELELDFSWITEPRRLKKKYAMLEAAYKDLHRDYDDKLKRIELLETELFAHRNKLPWVNIEELDGPQE